MPVVSVYLLKTRFSSENKRSVFCLMSIKICTGRAEHLREHGRLRFCDQRLDQNIAHGNINADCCGDVPALITGRQNYLVSFINIMFRDNLSCLPFYFPNTPHLFSRYKSGSQLPGPHIIAESRL